VLLVNDTPDLRRLKRLLLEQAGYSVIEMLDGQLVLDYLRASALPLVVVMNSRIPGLDAAGLLRTVTGEPGLEHHAFILTTALAHQLPDELVRLTRALRVPVLGKPFTQEDLLAAVASASERIQVYGRSDTGDDRPTHVQPSLMQASGPDGYQHPVSA
jgi:CheY-like chemotaxis protein